MTLQFMRGIIERGAKPELTREALDAVLRALGAAEPGVRGETIELDGR